MRERAVAHWGCVVKDRSVLIMGAPAEGKDSHEVEGSRLLKCELCGQPTFFAPSSLNHPEVANATFACLICALDKLTPETELAGPTDAQLREIAKVMKARQP